MNLGEILAEIAGGTTGAALTGVVVIAIVEFGTGVARAVASGQFKFDLVDTWVRKTVAGRVIPILLVLIAGAATPDLSVIGLDINILTTAGMTAAAAFAVSAVASIVGNLNPQTPDTPPTEE